MGHPTVSHTCGPNGVQVSAISHQSQTGHCEGAVGARGNLPAVGRRWPRPPSFCSGSMARHDNEDVQALVPRRPGAFIDTPLSAC
jgi:hypothetical protein